MLYCKDESVIYRPLIDQFGLSLAGVTALGFWARPLTITVLFFTRHRWHIQYNIGQKLVDNKMGFCSAFLVRERFPIVLA